MTLDKLPAVIASGFVLIFIADIIGNHLSFRNRFVNALVTSIIWGILFVALDQFYRYNTELPLVEASHLVSYTAIGVILAFISDLIGNYFVFNRRFANSFVTSIVWAITFGIVAYSLITFWESQIS